MYQKNEVKIAKIQEFRKFVSQMGVVLPYTYCQGNTPRYNHTQTIAI